MSGLCPSCPHSYLIAPSLPKCSGKSQVARVPRSLESRCQVRVGNAIGEDMECGQPALGDLFWSALDPEKQVPDPCKGESFPSENLKPLSRVLSNLGEL